MTNKLLILSTIFFIACSSNDINGYTDSIIKGLNETSDSPKKSNSLHKEGDPTSQSTSDNISSSSSETLYSLAHNPYTGEIKVFKWEFSTPDIKGSKKNPYGFDKDPNPNTEDPFYDPLIYVSLEIPENSSATEIKYDPSAEDIPIIELYEPSGSIYTDFYLLHQKYAKDIIDEKGKPIKYKRDEKGNTIHDEKGNPIEDDKYVEKLAEKTTQHGIKFTEKTEKEIITDITRNEKIKYSIYSKLEDANNNTYALGYSKENNGKKEYIIYPPLSQNNQQLKKYILEEGIYNLIGKRKLKNSKKNSEFNSLERRVKIIHYTKKTLNFVYVQIDGKKGDGWSPQSDKNSFITEESVENTFNKIYKQAVLYPKIKNIKPKDFGVDEIITFNLTKPNDDIIDKYKKIFDKKLTENGALNNNDSPYWHVIIAINKMRKKWSLERCPDDLSQCTRFNPENEPDYVNYKIYGCDNVIEENAQDVEIKLSKKREKINGEIKEKNIYHIIRKGKNGEEIDGYRDCDILFTDNGYPVIPGEKGISGAGAVSYPKAKKGYMPKGSLIIAPRIAGDVGKNVIMHELGHSFGLADVVKQKDLVYQAEKTYATKETNLMGWTSPAGTRIRYRATPIACTGGTKYYNKVLTKNGPILSLKGSLERKLENAADRQWECIRGKCFEKDYFDEHPENKEYWIPSELDKCKNYDTDELLKPDFTTTDENKKYKDVLLTPEILKEYDREWNENFKKTINRYIY